jgi:hypothetical protein
MDAVLTALRDSGTDYWTDAVEPLRQLTWQTLTLLAMVVLLTLLITTLLLHYSWVFAKPTISGVSILKDEHSYAGHIRLGVEDHLAFHRIVTLPMSELAKEARSQDQSTYYVVSVVQAKPRRELVYREMRLQAPPVGKARLPRGQIQLDARDLAEVRKRNSFAGDDDPEAPIEGTYNVYIRPVRWYDLRHWLMHPNREIRILIWVTIITTTVPTLIQVVFG